MWTDSREKDQGCSLVAVFGGLLCGVTDAATGRREMVWNVA